MDAFSIRIMHVRVRFAARACHSMVKVMEVPSILQADSNVSCKAQPRALS
jgi:hypothetical protein